MKTELNDRTLWHDGTNQVDPDKVPELFLLGVPQDKIVVNALSEDLLRFNQLSDDPIETIKVGIDRLDTSWNIPAEYKQLLLDKFLSEKILLRYPQDHDRYMARVKLELVEIEERGIECLIRTLIYVVDKLKTEDKVWGVGRGSSCASLVLHLIGVHEVDPIKYSIPLSEFFHD